MNAIRTQIAQLLRQSQPLLDQLRDIYRRLLSLHPSGPPGNLTYNKDQHDLLRTQLEIWQMRLAAADTYRRQRSDIWAAEQLWAIEVGAMILALRTPGMEYEDLIRRQDQLANMQLNRSPHTWNPWYTGID
ncbi:hypothetical protein BDV95DRAFT_595577 [Massariosphaeria phaeospora]|uniref:Uncharacterized protein n=1 Tax=Massariosphaeria phaeospora TaxID=100035 RepID=A0A7C8ICW7_9PLEO|nr:hypothetical protein BDV95DRAFT_595577 [Massariosphaeria phaeospora]